MFNREVLVKLVRLILMLSAGLFAGCVHVEQDLVIRENGSGDLRIVYGVKEQDLQRMRQVATQMAAIDPSLAPSDVDWLTAFDEATIRREWQKHAGEGVSLHHVKTESLNGWRFMRAAIRFDSLQQLLDCGMIQHCHIALTRGPQGQYGYQQSIDLRRWMKSMPGGMDMASIEPLATLLLRDFEAYFRIEVPGTITRHNADRIEGRRAIWHIEGDQPNALSRLQELDLRLMFNGRDLKIENALMKN